MFRSRILLAILVTVVAAFVVITVVSTHASHTQGFKASNQVVASEMRAGIVHQDVLLQPERLDPSFLQARTAAVPKTAFLRTCRCSCGFPCKTNADCGPGGVCAPGITCCDKNPRDESLLSEKTQACRVTSSRQGC